MIKKVKVNIDKYNNILCISQKCDECPNYHMCEEVHIYIHRDKEIGFVVKQITEEMKEDFDKCVETDCTDCSWCSCSICIMNT